MGRVVGITLFLEYTLHMIYTLSINIVGDIVQTVKKSTRDCHQVSILERRCLIFYLPEWFWEIEIKLIEFFRIVSLEQLDLHKGSWKTLSLSNKYIYNISWLMTYSVGICYDYIGSGILLWGIFCDKMSIVIDILLMEKETMGLPLRLLESAVAVGGVVSIITESPKLLWIISCS